MKLYIFDNGSLRIDESLSSHFPSTISLSGDMMYERTDWNDKREITIFLEEKVDWKLAKGTIKFIKLEENKEEKYNDFGFIFMNGILSFCKELKGIDIYCDCALSTKRWLQLKNDLLSKKDSNYIFDFTINQLNSETLKETEDTIESNIELFIESYSMQKDVSIPKYSI
jgi:hypothetical protein